MHWVLEGDADFIYDQGGRLSIRDCTRQVTLEFPTYDTAVYNRSIKKIDTFIAELVYFKDQLIADHDKRKRRYF